MRHALAATLLVALARPTGAEPAPTADALEHARTFYNAGRDAFYAAKYVVAIDALEHALALTPTRSSVQLALGKAYRFQYVIDGDAAKAARAVELLRAYVAQVGEGDDRRDAVAMIAELAAIADRYTHDRQAAPVAPIVAKTALMVVSQTPGAHASVDHGAATTVPAIVEVTAGRHAVHVEAGGFVAADVDGVAIDGQVVPVEVALKELPATLMIAAQGGAAISVDGRAVGTAPVAPVPVASGRHVVVVSTRGHQPYVREVVAARGETVTLDAPPLDRTGQRTAAYVVVGGAVAAAAGGVAASLFASSARNAADAILDRRDSGTLTEADIATENQHVDAFDRDLVVSYVLYAGAAALVATATWLYLADHPRAEVPQMIVAPVPTPGGAAISVSWSVR